MRCHSIKVILASLSCFMLLCSFNNDSVAIEKAVNKYCYSRPDSVLRLLDNAEEQKIMPVIRVDFLRALVYANMNMYTMNEACLRRVLSAKETVSDPKRHLNVLTMLVEALEKQNKYEEGLTIALQSLELAKSYGDRLMEYSLLCAMSLFSFNLDRYDDGYQYLNRVIESGKNTKDVRELSYVSYAYGILVNRLISDNRYEEAIEACKERSGLLERMKDMPGPPPGYIDQQKAYVYSKMANIYQSLGETVLAENSYKSFLQTEYSKDLKSGYSILPYLEKAGRNKEVLSLIDKLHSLWNETDTVKENYRLLLEYEANAEGKLGNYKNMAMLNARALVLADSIYTRSNKNRIQELATIFNVKEKEMQIKEEKAKSERNLIILSALILILVLLSVMMIIIYLNFRRLKKRNRIAARQIDELLEHREEIRQRLVHTETKNIESCPEEVRKSDNNEELERSYEIFLRMEQLIMEKQLFLQPRFGRDELLRITGINKNDLSSLLQKYAGVSNLSNYLNRLRVEYSVKLIKENKKFSIEAIAQEAGFNSRATFYRAFYKQFGMTPTEYIDSNQSSDVLDR